MTFEVDVGLPARGELDRDDLEYMTSPKFCKMIEERRREPTVPWEQVKADMFSDELKEETDQ